MIDYKDIERSIIKKYRKDIWSKFVKAINEYKLIEENDNIMVCISGGKDSFLLAKCIQEFSRHGYINFEAKYESIKRSPLLLLDDIGSEYLTPWARDEIIATILQYRSDEDLPTFFTSNLSLKELETHLKNTSSGIDSIKARRILERIKDLTIPFELSGENNRK